MSKRLDILPRTEDSVFALLDRLRADIDVGFEVICEMYAAGSAEDVARAIVALANTETGGVAFYGITGPPSFTERTWAAARDFERLVAEARSRISSSEISATPYQRRNLCALVVAPDGSCADFVFDEELGLDRGLFEVNGYDVHALDDNERDRFLDRYGVSDAEQRVACYVNGIHDLDELLDPFALEAVGLRGVGWSAFEDAGVVTAAGGLTRAAVVAFGSDAFISQYPGLGIVHREYDYGGAEVVARDLPPSFEKLVPGGAAQAVDTLSSYLADQLGETAKQEEGFRLFRELLVNAVGHRSLSFQRFSDLDNAVEVRIHPDQVCIISPGPLPEGKVRLVGGDHVARRFSRNPELVRLMAQLGFTRQKGVGLTRARAIAERNGYRLRLVSGRDCFEAHVPFDPQAALAVKGYRRDTPTGRVRMKPVERQERVIDALDNQEMTTRELAETLGWPPSTVRATIKQMVETKIVRRTNRSPRSPRQSYRVI